MKLLSIPIAALAMLLAAGAAIAEPPSTEQALQERVIGNPEAPVEIIEYASLTCPHCAKFHEESLPKLKKDWIETGKAKLVYRDYPLDKNAMVAAVIARCGPQERYFGFLDAFFSQQDSWRTSNDPVPILARLSRLGGLTREDIDACLENEALADGVLQMRLDGQMEYSINSTPTFVVNGKVVPNLPYEDFVEILEEAAK